MDPKMMSAEDVRDHLHRLIVEASQGEAFLIDVGDGPRAVLMGYDDWLDLHEQLDDLLDAQPIGTLGEPPERVFLP